LIAPFGGFFASGVKRAIGVKVLIIHIFVYIIIGLWYSYPWSWRTSG